MRIISGEYKGRRLSGGKKRGIRPTSDRVKETIFNVLQEEIEGKRILDLFAGAGSLGLEALSRGAESVTFVDSSPQSINVLRKNLEDLSLSYDSELGKTKTTLIRLDGLKAINKLKASFQIIFADPPYLKGYAQRIIDSIAKSEVLEKNGILILEHHKKEAFILPEENLLPLKQKKFGDTVVSFFLKRN